mmetsp:Transcript_71818/g.198252  ORF Transcript_71818/g.198252 Transcript_71818/m.198252 type:complete len:227 (-) Transcript_71818:4-684(-)
MLWQGRIPSCGRMEEASLPEPACSEFRASREPTGVNPGRCSDLPQAACFRAYRYLGAGPGSPCALAWASCRGRLWRRALAQQVGRGAVGSVAAQLDGRTTVLVLLLPAADARQVHAAAILAARLLPHVVGKDLAGGAVRGWADEVHVAHLHPAARGGPIAEARVTGKWSRRLDALSPVPHLAPAPVGRVVDAAALHGRGHGHHGPLEGSGQLEIPHLRVHPSLTVM